MDEIYIILILVGLFLGILERALNIFRKIKNLTKNEKDGQPLSK